MTNPHGKRRGTRYLFSKGFKKRGRAVLTFLNLCLIYHPVLHISHSTMVWLCHGFFLYPIYAEIKIFFFLSSFIYKFYGSFLDPQLWLEGLYKLGSVLPSFHLSFQQFSQNWLIIFETLHHVRDPYQDVPGCWIFFGKILSGQE